MPETKRSTRTIRIGSIRIGGEGPIAIQSMVATPTRDVAATARAAQTLADAGADVVRLAVDSETDVAPLAEIRRRTTANLVVDLQENWRLAVHVAPHVDKIRYNPGHLHHHERSRPAEEKVAWLASVAADHDLALRIGLNGGSSPTDLMVDEALRHAEWLDRRGFERYCVSLKDSSPRRVIEANRRFAGRRPDVPLHLGVTEAGLPPGGIAKTRVAFEALLPEGIGDTVRVSLTLPSDRKAEEVAAARDILAAVRSGRFLSTAAGRPGLDIVSCPSCGRVENARFVELAEEVARRTAHAADLDVKIAVMGCRVNGPGETDEADLGLWCGPAKVHLKRGTRLVGVYPYEEVLPRLLDELEDLRRERRG